MTRAMLWKEWREQRLVALAVLAFGALGLYLAGQFAEPVAGGSAWERSGPREVLALALAYLAGATCGAILLADEKEVGTLEFLDTLPTRRRTVWFGKAVAGVALAVGQCGALAGFAILFGSIDDRLGPGPYALLVVQVGVLAFAWGMFGGALARSALGAVFQGSVLSFLVGLLLTVPFVVVFGPRGFGRAYGFPLFTFYGCWVAVGLAGSALLFTGVDRRRTVAPRRPAAIRDGARKRWLAGVRALSWLSARQALYVAIGSVAAAVLAGAVMLVPESQPLFVWPGATLTLGVLAGVTSLGEEQVRGVARFWAERRLPLGRMWLVKVATHFLVALAAALALFAFIYAGSPSRLFRSDLVAQLRAEIGRFLLLGLVYGFAVGHLAGMLFRKTVVAGLVATVVAATLAGLILPGVIGGGASWWQVWGPATLLLVTARLILYPWATDRIALRGPVLRAAGGGALAILVLAAGLTYRIIEVPPAPDLLAESGYEESLPVFEANEVGHMTKSAVAQYAQAARAARRLYPTENPAGPSASMRGAPPGPYDPVLQVAQLGWTPEAAALTPWLDRVFTGDWVTTLERLADEPKGVFEDPRDLDYLKPLDSYRDLLDMSYAVTARGLRRQAAGDPEAFVRHLGGALAAIRTTRNRGGLAAVATALDGERALLHGLTLWLEALPRRPDLIGRVLRELTRHEAEMPTGSADPFWAEQVILRNTMDRIGTWLPRVLDPRADRIEGTSDRADAEANVVAFTWSIPWERIRRERLLRVETGSPVGPGWLSGLHLPPRWKQPFEQRPHVDSADKRALTRRRLGRLILALHLYHLERQAPAPSLTALVPEYLPAVPSDPYSGRPFGYRVSTGESVAVGLILMTWTDSIAATAAASVAHPVGGLNGLAGLTRLGSQARDLDPTLTSSTGRVVHAVPAGYGILTSAGPPDAAGDNRPRTGRSPVINLSETWTVLVRPLWSR